MYREKNENVIVASWLTAAIYVIGHSAITGIVVVLPTFLVWNWVMPAVFELPRISIFQAWGLIFLSGLFLRTRVSFAGERG